MSAFTLLEQDTEKTLELPRNTLKNTLIVSQSILLAGTVNLNKVKNSVPHVRGSGQCSAHADYKLLTRYFDQGKVLSEQDRQQYEQLTQGLRTLCWLILFKRGKRFGARKLKHLLLDGTKWDCGNETIHLMTLCVLVDDVAIPIWWEDLAKAGHSSQEERIAMLKDVMERYKLRGMMAIAVLVYILAIREGLIKEYRDGIRWVHDKRSGFEYRAVSVFLKGMDIVRRKALNLIQFIRYLRKITEGQYCLIFQNV